MTKSKWILHIALVVLGLVGCVKADKQNIMGGDGENPSRSFRLTKSGPLVDVAGYAENLIRSQDVDIKRSADVCTMSDKARYSKCREYSLKMCGLEDIRANNTLLGQKLRIYSELDILKSEVTVQNDSCVYWQVALPFEYFADSVNLEVNFIFKTVNGQKAFIHKKILFNPWDSRRGGNPETFDFTRFGISPSLNSLPWARGIDEIDLALQGKLLNTKKRLEIGSVNIVPVQKNKQNFVETNLLGTEVSQDIERCKIENQAQKLMRNETQDDELCKGVNQQRRVELNNNEVLQSLDLHLNIRLDNLKVRLFDTAGVNRDEQLTTGRYRIYAQIIATDQARSGHYIISDKLIVSNMKEWTTSTMGVNAVLPLSLVIRPQWGNLNLLLKVVPVDIPGVAPFEGLYHLGRFNDIAGGKSPLFDLSEYSVKKESDDFTFSYDEYLKKAKNHDQWEKKMTEDIDDVSTLQKGFRRFLFSQLDVLFSRIMPGDTSTDRTIQYTVETCLTDNFSGARPGEGLKFEIETEDRGVIYKTLRETNDLGCLTWVGMISHKYYHRENLVKKYSKLTYLGEDSNRPSYTLDYYINPWDEKFTFGRDARRLTPEYLEQIKKTQEAAPPTRILMTNFTYDATGFRYAIDRYMNMTVKKTVLMTIKPVILKYNSIVWGRSGLSDVRDGIYLLKIAMQKDYIDPMANRGVVITNDVYPHKRTGNGTQVMTQEEAQSVERKQFLVVKETLVRVLGGQIVTPIEFEINDLRTLRIRSQMLIQIETIDEMLLRAALIGNDKLNGLLKEGKSEKTVKIMGLQQTLDELKSKIDEMKANQDVALMSEYLQLIARSDELKAQMETILSTLDKDSVEKILSQIDEIRGTGETAISVDRNIKFRILNETILSMRKKMRQEAAKQEKEAVKKATDDKLTECRFIMSNLINQGKVDEAKLYDPTKADTDGSLCKTKIPKDELFYYLTSSGQVGSDEWFQALLTKDEFALYKSNLLRDDFTKPYPPDFDFSLLSNQGDERYFDDGKVRETDIDENISGLPRRTFIGPVTFVLNGNGSALRPTDVLDEAGCNGTCESLGEVESQIINNTAAAKEEVRKFGLPVNEAYENSPYFGSIEHFYKKQVNDLQAVNRGLKFQYHQEMKAFSQIGNFLDQTLLMYVSFGKNQAPVKRLDAKCYAAWKSKMEETYRKWRRGEDLSFQVSAIPDSCYVKSDRVYSLDAFERLNQYKRSSLNPQFMEKELEKYSSFAVDENEMKEFSKNGVVSQKLDFNTKIAILHRMCFLLRQQMHPQTEEFKEELKKRIREGALLGMIHSKDSAYSLFREKTDAIQYDCHRLVSTYADDVKSVIGSSKDQALINMALAAKSKQLPLVVERRVRVLETSNRYLYKDGKTLNYSVGTNFATGHSLNVNRGYKLDPLEVLEKTAAGVGGSAGKAASGFLGSISGMVNFQWGANESLTTSDGTAVGENTTLAAQISTLDIELSKWEKCVVVRFDEEFLRKSMGRHYAGHVLTNPSKDFQALGYFMCSGDEDTRDDLRPDRPLRVRERYFYLTQIFNEGDMQDPGALANHPWMLQLRGMRDFGRFERVLKTPSKDVNWTSPWEFMSRDLWSAMKLGRDIRHNDKSSMEVVNRDDVAKALDLMSDSFERVLPTFPGMYTFSDTPYDFVTGWPEK